MSNWHAAGFRQRPCLTSLPKRVRRPILGVRGAAGYMGYWPVTQGSSRGLHVAARNAAPSRNGPWFILVHNGPTARQTPRFGSRRPSVTRTVSSAARDIAAARRSLTSARHALAANASLTGPPVILDASSRRMLAALQAARQKLLAIRGVVGTGVGLRRRGGERNDGDYCIIVYVQKENRAVGTPPSRNCPCAADNRLPRSGERIDTDVVSFGNLVDT